MHATYIKNKEFEMSPQEQSLADDKMRAEIAKLLAETRQVTVNTFLAPALTTCLLYTSPSPRDS